MIRFLVAALVLCICTSATRASPWPEFPPHPFPVDANDVKKYWFKALPRPEQPSRNAADYTFALHSYRLSVSIGRDLIRQLRAGFFDRDARLTALRHNLAYYQRKNLKLRIKTTEEAIARARAELSALPTGPAIDERSPQRRRTASRASELRLARLEGSGGLHPERGPQVVSTSISHPTPSTHSHPPAEEPDIINIEVEEGRHVSGSCPPHQYRPPHRTKPPAIVRPHPFPERPSTTRPTSNRPTPVKPSPVRPHPTRPAALTRPTPVKPSPVPRSSPPSGGHSRLPVMAGD